MEKKSKKQPPPPWGGSLSITTPVSLLANEFDVRSVLHEQMSLAAVNQICVNLEAMNGGKNLKDSLKDYFEHVNIKDSLSKVFTSQLRLHSLDCTVHETCTSHC